MEDCHVRCVRRILGIPSTYGALKTGVRPMNNIEVLKAAGQEPFVVLLREQQLLYFGHLLRKDSRDPVWNLAFDRFLKPRILGGPRRRGLPRAKWAAE
eukprot:4607972-Alexandrium_andersonii.AAC.1